MNINSDISIIKILMLLILIKVISMDNSNLSNVIKNNMIAKHITLIITINVILSTIYKNISLNQMIFYSIIIYIVYLLSIKIDKKYVLIYGLLLTVLYFIDHYNREKINLIKQDKNIDSNKKDDIIRNINKKNNILLLSYILLILGTSIMYDDKQFEQHGGQYSILNYINF
jgi:hypothetical protein